MKKELIYLPFVLAGATIGYFIGAKSGFSGWDLFWELFYGMFLGLIIGMAFLENQYGILVGAAIGLILSAALNILAGTPITIKDKLGDMFICSIIGWYFPMYLKQMLIGGFVGGIIGFGWGMFYSHRVGNVGFPPGEGAILLAIASFVLGMAAAKLYMMAFGYRYLERHPQN